MTRERLEPVCGRCGLPLIGGAVLSEDGAICPGCATEVDGVAIHPTADELRSLVGVE